MYSIFVVLYVARFVTCIPTEPDIEPENYRLLFRDPEGCVQSMCDTFIGIDINSGNSSYLDIYLEGQADGYVAVGFSHSPSMFSADVVACVRDRLSDFVLAVDASNDPTPIRDNRIDPTQDIVLFNATFENSRIRCTVAKPIVGADVGTGFDLQLDAEQGLFVLSARLPGDILSDEGLTYHGIGLGRVLSANTVILVPPSSTTQPPSTTALPETPPITNEGSALIGFVAPTVTVSEGADAAVLCYSIIEGTLAQAFNIPSTQLSVSTLDITATGLEDYTPISPFLFVTFGRNVSVDCFHIPILEDFMSEGAENFTVTLSSTDRTLVMITQDTVQVVIVDRCLVGEVRLRGGFDEFQGRVEICYNGEWGTVCDDGWDDTDARVVCRQLGYPNSAVVRGFQNAVYGEGVGPILLDHVRCNGEEPELVNCTHNGFNVHECFHNEDASVDCLGRRIGEPCSMDGDVRLVNGQDETQGRVEFCYDGVWGTVCDNQWDDNDARVVCRQLGLNETDSVPLIGAVFGRGVGEIVLAEVSCFGNESTLLECSRADFFNHNCVHSQDAGVDCNGLGLPAVQVRVGFELASSLVLEDAVHFEICVAVFEGTPLNLIVLEVEPAPGETFPGQFSKRQIEQLAIFGEDYSFGGGDPLINLSLGPFNSRSCFDVEVIDDTMPENSEIIRLLLNPFFSDADYPIDGPFEQIVIVQSTVEITIIDNDDGLAGVGFNTFQAALVEGDTLQVCVVVLVGTLSTDIEFIVVSIEGSAIFGEDFTFSESQSSQISFTLGPSQPEYCFDIIAIDDNVLEEGSTIDAVELSLHPNVPTNGEFTILEPFITILLIDNDNCGDGHLCVDLEFSFQAQCLPSSFICNGLPECRDGSDEQGCNNTLVCEAGEFTCLAENRCLPMSYVCDGIPDCQIGGGNQPDELNCTTGCMDGDLRPLLGGTSDSEGIVEVCVNGQFRTLTLGRGGDDSEALSIREATVICKQLGQGTAGFPLFGRVAFGFEIATVDSDDLAFLQCQGTENRVADCVLSFGAFDNRQAGVRCINENPCTDGMVRLADGPNKREGRVEVCFQNIWGVVYDSNWEAIDAAVVCRELGYEFNGALPISPALYGALNSVRPVARVNPTCRADDRNLSNCSSSDIEFEFQDFNEVGFRDVVGVRCEAYSSGNCSHLDVRLGLRDNVIGSSGLVEICNDGVWSPLVPTGGIDFIIAEIICRQLNLNTTGPIQQAVYNVFNSIDTSLDTTPFFPPLSCEGFEQTLMECNSSSTQPRIKRIVGDGLFFQTGVRCRAPPRVFSYPPSLDGVYEVELGRPANVWCRWDPQIFPPVTIFKFNEEDRQKRGIIAAPQALPVFQSSSVNLGDGGKYRCTAMNDDRVNVSQKIRIKVRVPEGVGDSAFIRFSVPTIERLNATSGPDSIFQDREQLLTIVAETVVLPIIDVNTPGLQTVKCKYVSRGLFEMERELDRVECNITQYRRPEEVVVPVSQIAERAVLAVDNVIGVIVLGNSSANGFCDFEVTMSGGLSYIWPEASSGTTVSIPCSSDSSVMVTRMCGGSGQWEEPNLSGCVSTVFCEAENVTLPGEAAIYIWPETPAGEIVSISCIDSDGLIFRVCAPNGEWGTFDDDICGALDDGLEMLLNQTVNNSTYMELTSELSTILNQSESNVADQGQRNLRMVAQVFERVADFVNGSEIEIAPAVVQSLVQSLDSLLQWNATVLIDESSSNVVESFEIVVALFAQQVEIGENETIIVEDLVFVAERTSLETLQENGRGFTFSEPSDNERVVELGDDEQVTPGGLAPEEVAAIRLPASLFQGIENGSQTPGGSVGVFFAVYDVPSLFPLSPANEENENRTVGSRVLASTVGPGIDLSNLTEPVSIVLRLSLNVSQRVPGSDMCVSWDFILDDWTAEGCETDAGSDGVVTCNCTHLTNFAILVDLCSRTEGCEVNETFDKVLSFITIIGVSISMLGLALTVLTMLIFKKLRQKDASKYHIQLSIAIFCMLLVFIVGVERTENYGGCVTVSVLIHYFTLVAVMWMGAEALLMFQKLVIVFMRITTRYIVILSLVCWLVPLLPVLIPLIVDLATGNDPDNDIVVRRNEFCFLNHIGALYGAFLALIFLVIIFNLVVFIIVIYILIKHTRGQLSRQQERMKPATAVRLMISITGVMFLFGLSWLFAALSITNPGVRYTFQVLFTVFTAFQGLFIFLFFCVFSKEARESWKEFLSCGKYTSQFLHPSQYKQPTSSATTKRANRTGTTGSTGIASSTLGKPYVLETLSKTDYSSDTLSKTDLSSEIEKPSIIYENPVSTFETSTFEASTFTESVVKSESPEFETNAPRVSLEFSVEEICSELPLMGADGSNTELLRKFSEPQHVKFADLSAAQSQNGEAKELKPLKARIKRFSTRKAYAHHVESMQIDFYSDSSDGEEPTEL